MGKILFFNQCREIGGTDTFLLNLIKTWPSEEDAISVWYNKDHKGLNLYRKLDIDFKEINFPTLQVIYEFGKYNLPFIINKAYKVIVYLLQPIFFLIAIWVFYKKLRPQDFNVVFSSNGGYPAGELCQAIVIAAKLTGVKKVFLIIHNDALKPRFPFRYWEIWVDKMVSFACTEIISVSNACARQIEITRYFKRGIKVIYNGIQPERKDKLSLEEKRKFLKLDKQHKVIGSIGDYEERKGHEYLIKAFIEVKKNFPYTKLVIIGSAAFPYAKNLYRLIDALCLKEDVCLTGYLANAWEYMECFDIFALPSVSFESFGMVLLEAMLYKKPVIGTSVGGIPEVLGDAGYIVEPRNPDKLAEKLDYLLEYPDKAKELGERGFPRLQNNFTSSQMAKEYSNLIKG